MTTPDNTRPNADAIEDFIVERVIAYTKTSSSDIGSDSSFASLGLGSKEALLLIGELEEWLDLELTATLAWEYPTIGEMAEYLAGAMASSQ